MNISKQFINLLGGVVLVAVLVAGALLGAFPLYGEAQRTDVRTRTVAQTNGVYDLQVAQLTEAEGRIGQIDADVAALRREIAAIPQLDDVFEIVIGVAEETGATIETISAADPEAFVPRSAAEGEDASARADTAPAASEPAAEPAAPAEGATAAESGDVAGEAPPQAAGESSQRQIPITITMQITDAGQAAAFMDALGRGPRLLSLIDGTLDDGALTVTALAFTRMEN